MTKYKRWSVKNIKQSLSYIIIIFLKLFFKNDTFLYFRKKQHEQGHEACHTTAAEKDTSQGPND